VKSGKPFTSKNGFFGPQNTAVPLGHSGKKTFSLTLNLMISQIVRNEFLRFGGHVGIQVSYKFLRLEVLKDSPVLVRVVLSDVLGGKNVVEGRDGQTDGRFCLLSIGCNGQIL
jgi:hypothetical protein